MRAASRGGQSGSGGGRAPCGGNGGRGRPGEADAASTVRLMFKNTQISHAPRPRCFLGSTHLLGNRQDDLHGVVLTPRLLPCHQLPGCTATDGGSLRLVCTCECATPPLQLWQPRCTPCGTAHLGIHARVCCDHHRLYAAWTRVHCLLLPLPGSHDTARTHPVLRRHTHPRERQGAPPAAVLVQHGWECPGCRSARAWCGRPASWMVAWRRCREQCRMD